MENYLMEEILLDKVYEYKDGCPVCGNKENKEFKIFLDRSSETDEKVEVSCTCGFCETIRK